MDFHNFLPVVRIFCGAAKNVKKNSKKNPQKKISSKFQKNFFFENQKFKEKIFFLDFFCLEIFGGMKMEDQKMGGGHIEPAYSLEHETPPVLKYLSKIFFTFENCFECEEAIVSFYVFPPQLRRFFYLFFYIFCSSAKNPHHW